MHVLPGEGDANPNRWLIISREALCSLVKRIGHLSPMRAGAPPVVTHMPATWPITASTMRPLMLSRSVLSDVGAMQAENPPKDFVFEHKRMRPGKLNLLPVGACDGG